MSDEATTEELDKVMREPIEHTATAFKTVLNRRGQQTAWDAGRDAREAGLEAAGVDPEFREGLMLADRSRSVAPSEAAVPAKKPAVTTATKTPNHGRSAEVEKEGPSR